MAESFVLPYETPILTSLYTLGENLRESQYGTTHLCLDKSTGEEYACKSISKSSLRRYDAIRREIQIMHRVSGIPSVVAFRDAYEDSEHVHLVTELCDGGDLFDRVIENESYYERDAVELMKTIVGFVQDCHSLGVLHRDLRPENVLFKSRCKDSPLKVVDFGLAVFFRRGDIFREVVGNPYYVAPEVLKKRYGPEADVWSVGIILYMLLSGVPPFSGETNQEIFRKILEEPLDLESHQWAHISHNAKDLIRGMLEKDPKKRISPYYILGHPWMTDESSLPDTPLDSVRLRLREFSNSNTLQRHSDELSAVLSNGNFFS